MTFRTLLRVAALTGDDIPVAASLEIDCLSHSLSLSLSHSLCLSLSASLCLYIFLRRTAQNSIQILLKPIKDLAFCVDKEQENPDSHGEENSEKKVMHQPVPGDGDGEVVFTSSWGYVLSSSE